MTDEELDRTVTARINSDAVLASYNIDVDADAESELSPYSETEFYSAHWRSYEQKQSCLQTVPFPSIIHGDRLRSTVPVVVCHRRGISVSAVERHY
jgi:hypothetical protein